MNKLIFIIFLKISFTGICLMAASSNLSCKNILPSTPIIIQQGSSHSNNASTNSHKTVDLLPMTKSVIGLQLNIENSKDPLIVEFNRKLFHEKLNELYGEYQRLGYSRTEIESIYAELYEEVRQSRRIDRFGRLEAEREKREKIDEQRNSIKFPLTGRTKQVVDEILRQLSKTKIDEVSWEDLKKITNMELEKKGIVSLQKEDFMGLEFLEWLNLSNNQITNLHQDIFRYNPVLKVLTLDYNQLSSLHQDTFRYNPKLQVLSLSYNQLSSLHQDIFRYNLYLHDLFLTKNQLSDLHQDIFRYSPKLFWLRLDYNQLSNIHEDIFSHNSYLQIIYLNNNQLSYIESNTFKNNPKITVLHLEGNLFGMSEKKKILKLLVPKATNIIL